MHDPTSQLIILTLLVGGSSFQEESAPEAVTWHGQVEAIVHAHCASCHQAGGVGPFPLQTYDEVARRGSFIAHVVKEEIMPPWLPSAGGPFRESRGMTAEDRALLEEWVAAGMPRGTPDVVEEHTEGAKSSTGEQKIFSKAVMRAPWNVPAEGGRRWFKAERDKRTFVLPLGNEEPLRVQAIEYRTKAPLALAATALAADTTGNARRLVDWDEEPGSYMMGDIGFVPAGSLGIVGPGGGRVEWPTGFHKTIAPGADLLSEVHFRPQGRTWQLNDSIVLEHVPEDVPSRELIDVNVMVRQIKLEPGEERQFTSDITLPVAVDLVALSPRASRRCRKFRLEALLPDAKEPQVLLEVDDWNPHYRSTLVFEEPRMLPAGTRVEARWFYDNRAENPRNPVVPPEAVSLGARVGSANVLLVCAPVDEAKKDELRSFALSEMRRRQR